MITDLRYALRMLLKSPGFSSIAILTLALGIGVNAAIFSLVHALLFQAPAYTRPNQIVQVFSQNAKDPKVFRGFSYPTYRDIREQNTVFDDLLAHNLAMIGIGEKADSRRAFADLVSANYFSVLGITPIAGRAFVPAEETPGSNTRVAIVSYSYWQKHGGDPGSLGSSIQINGRPYTIVGILPEGFTGTMHIFSPEVWLPLGVYDQVANNFQSENHFSLGERGGQQLLLLGRLKAGITSATAAPALKGLAANLEKTFPVEQKDQTFITAPLSRFATSNSPDHDGQVSMLGTLLLSMAAVVLLVACLNLANMLLARGTARRKEFALRLALGAHRRRIVRQLLTEGLVLALLGGIIGLLLALWSSDLLVASLGAMLPVDLVWLGGPNFAVLAATFGFCVLGTLGFGLGPALKLSRAGVMTDLKEHAAEDPVSRHWKFFPRNPLVVAQIAFSLALLTAAALFVRGAIKAASADTGLKTDRTFLLELDSALSGYDQTRGPDLYRALQERLVALPGVEHTSISATIPFGMISLSKNVRRDGLQPATGTRPATAAEGLAFDAAWNSVGADYFATVGLPLIRGRAFSRAEATQPGGPAVAIIDAVLAKKLWPDGNALGRRIQFASSDAERAKREEFHAGFNENKSGEIKPGESIEIVGIVPATRHALFESDPSGAIYLPFARGFQSNIFVVIKFNSLSRRNEVATADLLRRTVHAIDPALAVLSLKTFDQHLESNVQLWLVRAGAALFSIFGGLALGLSVVGVYGVKAYAVARRTREIGIRMALGARPGAVQWMFLREGFVMLGAGLVIGLLLAVGIGKVVSGLLYEVGALDPIAFTIAPLLLAAAALLATWFPARRAARVDPMVALRSE